MRQLFFILSSSSNDDTVVPILASISFVRLILNQKRLPSGQFNFLSKRTKLKGFFPKSKDDAALIQPPFGESMERIDPSVTEEGPMGSYQINFTQRASRGHNRLGLRSLLGDNLPAR